MKTPLVIACCFISVFLPLVVALDGDTFTVNCVPLTIQRADPIVNPGVAGGHLHSIIGMCNKEVSGAPLTYSFNYTQVEMLSSALWWELMQRRWPTLPRVIRR